MKHGDFSQLATYYKYRPDYSESVLNALIGLVRKPANLIDFVDVGAGTGIWTRMVWGRGVNATAIEPNEFMLSDGFNASLYTNIRWISGTAEETGLKDACCDWVTMASSFHWADTNTALKEFHRILRRGGMFTALWNPRVVEANPLLMEIETTLKTTCPEIKRVSSGLSGITKNLTKILEDSDYFEDVVYIEGKHVIKMSPERYINIWRSVNDIPAQIGEKKFEEFLSYIAHKLQGLESIDATYLTRAWSARKKK